MPIHTRCVHSPAVLSRSSFSGHISANSRVHARLIPRRRLLKPGKYIQHKSSGTSTLVHDKYAKGTCCPSIFYTQCRKLTTSPARLVRGVRKAAGTGSHHPPVLCIRGSLLLVLVIAFFVLHLKFANIIREASPPCQANFTVEKR